MQWIKASKTWRTNPRFVLLETEMGWSKHEAISRWLHFLWWCSEHREDGILKDVSPQQIARAFDAELKDGEKLVEVLLKAGFLDRDKEWLRVTHWLDLAWAYLQQKYHTRQRAKLQEIANQHKRDISQLEAGHPAVLPWEVPVSISPSQSPSSSKSVFKSGSLRGDSKGHNQDERKKKFREITKTVVLE